MISRSRQKAKLLYEACSDKKGFDMVCLDVRNVSPVADFFVIASGTSDRHVAAMAEAVADRLKDLGEKPKHWRDLGSSWLLIDSQDVMVHLFREDAREFYALEALWGKAKKLHFS
jgi:ribosome-associated protein